MRVEVVATFVLCACASADGVPLALPNGSPGIGFDDLRYSARLQRIIAPAGRTGGVALVDPASLAVEMVTGFSSSPGYDGGHDFGATSADEGRGLLFVTDRTSQKVTAIDVQSGSVVGAAALAASPDYVRYVAPTDELWITEPDASQIEIFAAATLQSKATVPVDNGPESLEVDVRAGLAYTHRWQSETVVLDIATRAPVATWPNGCAASRGLALDPDRGFFFAACLEGTVSVLDTRHDGRALSAIARGAGYDVIGYDASLGHVYLAGTACSCMVVLGVSSSGELSFLGRYEATGSAHCATADGHSHAWVCDPEGGRLLRIDDPFPASW